MTVTIQLNGLEYYVSERDHREQIEPIRSTAMGLTGKTIVVDFGFNQTVFDVRILCYLDGYQPSGFGGISDLEAAWAMPAVDFVDVNGAMFQVVPTGRLDLSRQFSLVVSNFPFRVDLSLEKING